MMKSSPDIGSPMIRELRETETRDPSLFTTVIVDMLTTGTSVKFTAVGRSMLPAIRAGDRLTVVPCSVATIQRGDVALYRRYGGLTAHRVLAFGGSGSSSVIRVRGDASRGCIDEIPFDDMLGCVTWVERGARSFRMDTPVRRFAGLLRAAMGTWRVRAGHVVRGVVCVFSNRRR
ncbi:MAG: S24/S26 family peptidase [Kiritimatiellae bacterium]|nr:S24/S26 family peptidase [Kiritimatiellia bacterium]